MPAFSDLYRKHLSHCRTPTLALNALPRFDPITQVISPLYQCRILYTSHLDSMYCPH